MGLKDALSESNIGMRTKKIESVPQLCKECQTILNTQIKNEFNSAQIYFGMSAWFDNQGWNNAGKLFLKYGHEEMEHMKKVTEFMYDRNCKVDITSLPDVDTNFSDTRDVVTKALAHEISITKNWRDIAACGIKCNEHDVVEFSNWFLREQNEEENKQRDILDLINLGIPNWKLEEEFKEKL